MRVSCMEQMYDFWERFVGTYVSHRYGIEVDIR
jgi:hypothetical protein